jgi:hypothetical protein
MGNQSSALCDVSREFPCASPRAEVNVQGPQSSDHLDLRDPCCNPCRSGIFCHIQERHSPERLNHWTLSVRESGKHGSGKYVQQVEPQNVEVSRCDDAPFAASTFPASPHRQTRDERVKSTEIFRRAPLQSNLHMDPHPAAYTLRDPQRAVLLAQKVNSTLADQQAAIQAEMAPMKVRPPFNVALPQHLTLQQLNMITSQN